MQPCAVAKKEYPEQTKVFECIKDHIFKKYKFCKYDDPQLEYLPKKGSICKIIIQQCRCSNNVDNDEWWSVAKCWIARKIIVLRNDVVTQLKKHFWSKCLIYFV